MTKITPNPFNFIQEELHDMLERFEIMQSDVSHFSGLRVKPLLKLYAPKPSYLEIKDPLTRAISVNPDDYRIRARDMAADMMGYAASLHAAQTSLSKRDPKYADVIRDCQKDDEAYFDSSLRIFTPVNVALMRSQVDHDDMAAFETATSAWKKLEASKAGKEDSEYKGKKIPFLLAEIFTLRANAALGAQRLIEEQINYGGFRFHAYLKNQFAIATGQIDDATLIKKAFANERKILKDDLISLSTQVESQVVNIRAFSARVYQMGQDGGRTSDVFEVGKYVAAPLTMLPLVSADPVPLIRP